MRALKPILTAIVATALALPLAIAGPGNGNGGPTHDTVDVQFNMTGTAILTGNGGPDDTYTFYINASGEATRKTPNGNGVQIRSDSLPAQVVVLNAEGNEVENYTANLRFHAQQASHIAQGLEGFKFNMQLTGKRSESVTGNSAHPDGRVMSMNAHGDSTYVDATADGEDNGAFTVNGRGQTTTKDGQDPSARHYNFLLGGTGTIS